MFEFVAKHKRLLQLVLLLVIVPPFALWGVDSYQKMLTTGATDVADVDGQKITDKEFSDALRQQQERLRAMLGGKIDPSFLDTPKMRREILDGMISQRLVTQHAVSAKLYVSDEQLREVIASIPAFQDGGKFSKTRYEAALTAEGLSPATFENSLRRDLMTQQLVAGISEAGISSRTVAARIAAARAEQREVSQFELTAAQYRSQVKTTPESIKAFYEANKQLFAVPEQVRAEYVVLTADAVAANDIVSLADVKKVYEQNQAKLGQPEQRQASHILIAFKQGASDSDKAKVREKAAQLLDPLRKAPGSFAELAKKNSEDPASGARGGDLGYFSRGMMVKPFEDAVFAMNVNELRGPVESEFGVHIIKLTGIKAAKVKSLEEVRPEIEAELRKQNAGRRFAEASESFSNLAYEQADSLKPVSEKFKVAVQQADWTTRQSSPVKQLNNPRVLAALFSDDVVRSRHNTEVIEIAPGTLVAARVVEHRAASQRPLEEVKDDVVKQLTDSEAAALARKDGAVRLEAVRKGDVSSLKFSPAKMISRENSQGLPAEGVNRVFRAEVASLPAYVGADTTAGYAIYRIGKVVVAPADANREKGMQVELGRMSGAQEFRAYVASLRGAGKVQINEALLEKKPQ